MVAFPSFWQLLLPNLNWATAVGIIIIALGVLWLMFSPIKEEWGILSIFIGAVLMWGYSIVEDLLRSSAVQMYLIISLAVGIAGLFIFWDDLGIGKKK